MNRYLSVFSETEEIKNFETPKIIEVDGDSIRDKKDADFIGGGHHLVYNFIPENEIWIEKMPKTNDQKEILTHELFEWFVMKHIGLKYERAHEIATELESCVRNLDK